MKIARIVIGLCLVVFAVVAIGAASLDETTVSTLPRPIAAVSSALLQQAQETLRQADLVWNGR